jgi:DNA-directed RNA polymerase subunit E'/Rpb7
MFFLSSLTKEICLYPKDLTTDIKSLISDKIRELEGTVVGNYGYIISIIEFNQTSKGKIDNETGRVNYKVMYKAITYKPVVGEILNVSPFFINEHGFFCKVGHLQIFVSQHMMKNWKYNPEDNIWQNKTSEADKTDKTDKTETSEIRTQNIIKIGDTIRIKIIAFRINSNEITALAEIKN